jgi:hypothetical protein
MPDERYDEWTNTLPNGKTVTYTYRVAARCVVAEAKIEGSPLVYAHAGLPAHLTRAEIQAEFEHDLAET